MTTCEAIQLQERPLEKTHISNPCDSYRVYQKRWLVLTLFVLFAAGSAFQWIQYCIIANVVTRYYNVSALMVDWTSLVSMVVYPPLLLPATYIMDRLGLRAVALLAALGTCLGTCIKLLSVGRHLFWVTFAGQTIVSIAMLFILSLPPKLAATWFGTQQVSTACSIGVFGTQLGTAVGFLLPPILVPDSADLEQVASGLSRMFHWVAYYTAIVSVLVILFFEAEPETPPSVSQAEIRKKTTNNSNQAFINSYKALLTNKAFMLLTVSYGINVGVFAAISTILNQVILDVFPHSQEFAGRVGLLIVLIGMIGSIMFGAILDKTKAYKKTTVLIYFMTAIGMGTFCISLRLKSATLVYVSSSLLGFFMNAYYPVGFELAAELTYPEAESTSCGILTSMAQTCGILFTYVIHFIHEMVGVQVALAVMVTVLMLGTALTAVIPNHLRRQQTIMQNSEYNIVSN